MTRQFSQAPSNYIKGFSLLNDSKKVYACVAALGCRPIEAFTQEMLRDDRLCRVQGQVRAAVKGQVDLLEAVPSMLWDRLAAGLQMPKVSGSSLQSKALAVCHKSLAFLDVQ
eukprot:2607957-Lingulodinium_polyedra.AAC.1